MHSRSQYVRIRLGALDKDAIASTDERQGLRKFMATVRRYLAGGAADDDGVSESDVEESGDALDFFAGVLDSDE